MTQEVGTVEAVEGSLDVSRYPIGSFLKIIPYHVSVVIIVNRHNAALYLPSMGRGRCGYLLEPHSISTFEFFQSCATAYMHHIYYVVKEDQVVDKWIPNRGW